MCARPPWRRSSGTWCSSLASRLTDRLAVDHLPAHHRGVLAVARAKLLDARAKRIRPGLDDKILADWNGLMIAALATAASLFDEPAWLAAAQRAYGFVLAHMQAVVTDETRLRHSWRAGVALDRDVLDDYAQMIRAALALHQATGEQRYLAECNGTKFDNYVGWLAIVSAITVACCPAMSIPCGFTREGLPVGLQIVAAPRGEARVLAGGKLLETILGLGALTPIDPRPGK